MSEVGWLIPYSFSVPTGPPGNLVAEIVSSTEIRALWDEVAEIDRNGLIIEFEVMYEPLMTFDMLSTLTIATTNLSINLIDLEEYVEYNISVRAFTSIGPGPYSVGIVVRTFENGKYICYLYNSSI